mgnify:CR=1
MPIIAGSDFHEFTGQPWLFFCVLLVRYIFAARVLFASYFTLSFRAANVEMGKRKVGKIMRNFYFWYSSYSLRGLLVKYPIILEV